MAISDRAARRMARAKASQAAQEATSKRAIGYVRVSTEEQANKGHGLQVQESAIRAFAESQGYELADVIGDHGVSGATPPPERPGFARVVDHAEAGGFVLLVWKFDRFSRNIRHALNTVQEVLTPRNVELRSVTEAAIDTGSTMGRMIFSIFAGMAEGERETITLRTKSGRLAKARKGGIACGTAPLGYRRREDGSLAVDEGQARTVRLIYELRRDGLRYQDIADKLNVEGLRGRDGGMWRKGSVGKILGNPKFKGSLEYLFTQGDELVHVHVPDTHEAIVG